MTVRTRRALAALLVVLIVGAAALAGYHRWQAGGSLLGRDGPDELRYVSRDAAVVAAVDIRAVMASALGRRVPQRVPPFETSQRWLQDRTGIDIASDVDRLVASLEPFPDRRIHGLVLLRGRFDAGGVESRMRARGAAVEDYAGARVMTDRDARGPGDVLALSFLEPGLAVVGDGPAVRAAIDRRSSGDSVRANARLMERFRRLDRESVWAVGELDALRADGQLPAPVASQLGAVTGFSVAARVDSRIDGVVRADTRDEAAAGHLREAAAGFLALARLGAGRRPEVLAMMQSLTLGVSGASVSLSFSVPGEIVDAAAGASTAAPPGRSGR